MLTARIAHSARQRDAGRRGAHAPKIGGAQQRRRGAVQRRVVRHAGGASADDKLARPGRMARRDEGQAAQQHRGEPLIAWQQCADRVGFERMDELVQRDDSGPGEAAGMIGDEVGMRRRPPVVARPVDHGRMAAKARPGDHGGGAVGTAQVVQHEAIHADQPMEGHPFENARRRVLQHGTNDDRIHKGARWSWGALAFWHTCAAPAKRERSSYRATSSTTAPPASSASGCSSVKAKARVAPAVTA